MDKQKEQTAKRIAQGLEAQAGGRSGPGKSLRKGLTLPELFQMFPDDEAARKWFESQIWPNGPVCPRCNSGERVVPSTHKSMPHRCTSCRDLSICVKSQELEYPRVTLIENFASRKTVKEKLNDRQIAEPPMDENSKKIRELTEAMHAERDIRIRNRMMAVLGVLKGRSTKIASDFADVDQRTVQLWVARFDEGGIGGLRDAPGRGRASHARYGRIRKLADRLAGKNMLTPRKLRNQIRCRLDARHSLCSVRRILRLLGFSSKRFATRYASAADAGTARQWQTDASGTISGAKRRGFTIVVQDESIFLRTGTNGRKLWPRVGDPVTVNRHGRRDKTVVYGTLAEYGTRLMRQYGRFDGPTFVRYLKEVRRKWGDVLLITDNASQHKTKAVREYLEENDGMEILYLPTATPKLSAVESVWKDAKYRLVTSEHYETLENLTHAVSEYFRTCSNRLDIYRFLYRCM